MGREGWREGGMGIEGGRYGEGVWEWEGWRGRVGGMGIEGERDGD